MRREYTAGLPQVPGYPAELNQVWTNLIDNAADAMAGSGVLTLRTRADDDAVFVEIADDGPGVPEEVRDRLFEPFVTTKPTGEGSGLGLENARRIIERRHGGSLNFSTGPEGTTFCVRLPLRRPAGELLGGAGRGGLRARRRRAALARPGRGVRGLPADRRAVGAPAPLPDLRPRRLLRLLAAPARRRARRRHRRTRWSPPPSPASAGPGATPTPPCSSPPLTHRAFGTESPVLSVPKARCFRYRKPD